MKIWLFCFCTIFCFCGAGRAQEDILAMIKQIGLLEVYIVDLEKGYKIAREGLTTIGEIKKGEFNLHNIFFSSLQSVNPSVAKYSKIAEIISDQLAIISGFKSLIKRLKSSGRITAVEMNYISSVYSNISDECSKSVAGLIAVTTDGTLEMTDDERIRRINGIWGDMKDKYAFTQRFTAEAGALNDQRVSEENQMQLLKSLE
jgi:hypothetical protein